MIDSGATGNFIGNYTIEEKGLLTRSKTNPYVLYNVEGGTLNREKGGVVRKETKPLPVVI